MNVKLTNAEKIKLSTSADMYGIMQKILLRANKIDRNKEHFWTIGLDNAHRILYIELISVGTTTRVEVEPMQVYRVAVLKGAVNMILVHNHPSGEIKPSKEDIQITDRLFQVGRILGIMVIDHLIISEKSYNSFADTNILAAVEKSTHFVPGYELKEKIKKEAIEIGKQEGKKEEKKQMVRTMKQEGYSVEQIIKLTGLTKEEINAIRLPKPKTDNE